MNPAIPIDSLFAEAHPVERAAAAVLDNASASELANFFRIMADPTRVRIFSALAGAELCVTDLKHILNMEQSAVSHQLRALRDWGLVRYRKAGRQVFYSLDPERTPDFFISSLARARRR